MKQNILAISGKPGLFLLVSRGRTTLIVETLDAAKKRFSVGLHDRVSSLNDISIYTTDEDVTLMKVFENIRQAYDGKVVDINAKKASKQELAAFMEKVLPNYDEDRVYPNDIKKLITWYNLLTELGYTDFEEKEEGEEAETPEAEKPAE